MDKEGNLHPAKASILKNGDISVIADKVKEPVGVRYCFSNDAMPNLFDSNGLPLAPFRTDRKNEKVFIIFNLLFYLLLCFFSSF